MEFQGFLFDRSYNVLHLSSLFVIFFSNTAWLDLMALMLALVLFSILWPALIFINCSVNNCIVGSVITRRFFTTQDGFISHTIGISDDFFLLYLKELK
jgi:hypothetical protein